MTAALYARVSTTDQDCTIQLTELRRYAAAQGWDTIEYVDAGVSGARANRPALDKLMADAAAKRINVVCVWKLDRWGRSLQHCVNTIEELKALNVRWLSVTQGLDTGIDSPMSRVFMGIMTVFAAFERELIAERMAAGWRKYNDDYAAGKRVQSRSGKNMAIGRPKRIFNRALARELRLAGKSWAQVAAACGVPMTTVRREIEKV